MGWDIQNTLYLTKKEFNASFKKKFDEKLVSINDVKINSFKKEFRFTMTYQHEHDD